MKTSQIELIRTKTRKQVAKIPLTEEEHQKLIVPGKDALTRYQTRTQTANDWFVLTFRMRTAIKAAQRHYTDETVSVVSKAHDILMDGFNKYQQDENHDWNVSSKDFLIMADALDVVEAIQRDVKRETMMFAVRTTHNEMLRYVAA